jgi:hypothetical protein
MLSVFIQSGLHTNATYRPVRLGLLGLDGNFGMRFRGCEKKYGLVKGRNRASY